MSMVTISKKEYHELVERKLRYEYLRQIMNEDIFSPPPVRSRKEIIRILANTGKYNREFLRSLEKGLEHSPSFTK